MIKNMILRLVKKHRINCFLLAFIVIFALFFILNQKNSEIIIKNGPIWVYYKEYKNESYFGHTIDWFPYDKSSVKINNRQFTIFHEPANKDTLISASLKHSGSWENNLIQNIINELLVNKDVHFLDIGVNLGTHSLGVLSIPKSQGLRQVVGVEPIKYMCDIVYATFVVNKVADRMTLINNAVFDSRGTKSFLLFENGVAASRLNDTRINTNHKAHVGYKRKKLEVESIFLDDLIPAIPFRDAVMKIDIEGSEAVALSGAKQLFELIKIRAVFMEWQNLVTVPGQSDYIKTFMTERGYKLYNPYSMQPYPISDIDKMGDVLWKK